MKFATSLILCLTLIACGSLKRTDKYTRPVSEPTPVAASVTKAPAPTSVASIPKPVNQPPKPQPPRAPSKISTTPVGFDTLPGWNKDAIAKAIPAFRKSCKNLVAKPDDHFIGKTKLGGKASDWKAVCGKLRNARLVDDRAAKAFITDNFEPHLIAGRGIFTGYYEPLLNGSLTQDRNHLYPLYIKPKKADSWMSTKGSGPTRRLLEGVWSDNLKPLVWLEDPVDVFMLQVQGSGLVQLTNGRRMRVSYSGDNGHKYKSIFPAMQRAGFGDELSKSLQSMTKWLKENPTKATEIMYENPRFIFFRAHASDGPIGAEGVTLTSGRSMAVDTKHIPLGVPLWLDTNAYYRGKMVPVQRLMIAQDVGAAIKGTVRGDVYWGTGAAALEVAGNMKEPGRYFILLPRKNAANQYASKN